MEVLDYKKPEVTIDQATYRTSTSAGVEGFTVALCLPEIVTSHSMKSSVAPHRSNVADTVTGVAVEDIEGFPHGAPAGV